MNFQELPPPLSNDLLHLRSTLPLKPAPIHLTGSVVELRPLDLDADTQRLYEISNGSPQLGAPAYDPEPVVWRYMGAGPFADASEMRTFLTGLNATPNLLPMCVRRKDGELIGSWRPRQSGKSLRVAVRPWRKLSAAVHKGVTEQAERLAAYRGVSLGGVDVG